MRGGWRYGAGRPASHAQVSQVRKVDVRLLHREGHLVPLSDLHWVWRDQASLHLRIGPGRADLRFRYPRAQGEWQEAEFIVAIARTSCNFGGDRPWFVCPNCARRCAIIYLRGWPRCRRCAQLVYPSQSESAIERSWQRTSKILRKLGQGDAALYEFPRRPKGMRQVMFDRLREGWCREKEFRDAMIGRYLARRGLL